MNLEPIEVDGNQYYLPTSDQLYKAEPELKSPVNGDWYIYYSIWDFEKGKWLPQKFYSEFLNKKELLKNKKLRLNNGEKVRKAVYNRLKEGINPKTAYPLSPFVNKSIEEIMAHKEDDSPIPTVRKAIAIWLPMKSGKDNPNKATPENKENTETTYKYFFAKFLSFCEANNLADVRLDKVPKHMVYKFFEQRYNNGEIGDSTWNGQLAYVKGMFAYFSKLYDYKNNIVNIEEKEVIDDSERFEPFSPEQLRAIFKELDSPRVFKHAKYERAMPPNYLLAYAARTIYYTFIRVSELRRIKIKHVKRYKEGYFTLSAGITKTKKKIFNDLYIDPILVEEFSKLEWEKYFTDKKYDEYYVFTPNMVPSPNKPNNNRFSRDFNRVLVKLGIIVKEKGKKKNAGITINKYSLYSMKPSGNRDAYNSGWDLLQISIQNRHTTVTQTETYLRKLKCDVAARPRPVRSRV